ncbi:coagulation factor 5/8 type domain-containing protein [Actinoplanes sp. ATCC 53533]|uniref:DUF1996 domain-containing protein n=1 Tax=Actinoplanes sp. ATCC 53533 TaxID=1288362 RepID=UPI000F7B3B3B|nr:DUF1996 domain-containing protein [Actinoplanes sp. ATCC 53533]RSM45346.1 coagulation factor 5/8 type domain-containing protein [Actinoplanes sp. ATCC 53533]
MLIPTADAATSAAAPPGAVRASSYNAQSGAAVEVTRDTGGGKNVGWLADGDWLRYDSVDLGAKGDAVTSVRFAAAYKTRPGTVEVRIDSLTGQLLAVVPVKHTGGNQDWRTATAAAHPSPGGKHTVFLVIRSIQPNDFVNLNWFAINPTSSGTPSTPNSSGTPSASPSVTVPTASPSATSATPTPAATTGWIPVDQERWAAQLAAFRAMTPRPVPANRGRNAEFNATCQYSHSAPDDPIVFPNMAGASHLHSFVGNDSTNAASTPDSLTRLTASSCKPFEDHSAYWVPTLFEHGKAVEPEQVVVYYGSLLEDKTKTVPMPYGMRMIAGDAKKQEPTPRGAVNQFYCAGGPQDGKTRSTDGNWPVCDGGTLHFTLRFPDCWDGKHLDSPNHKSHVAFGGGGKCSGDYPVAIPALTFSIAYPTSGTADGFKLASGMASSMHGDAFLAWEDDAMAHRVKDCVVQETPCNTAGKF